MHPGLRMRNKQRAVAGARPYPKGSSQTAMHHTSHRCSPAGQGLGVAHYPQSASPCHAAAMHNMHKSVLNRSPRREPRHTHHPQLCHAAAMQSMHKSAMKASPGAQGLGIAHHQQLLAKGHPAAQGVVACLSLADARCLWTRGALQAVGGSKASTCDGRGKAAGRTAGGSRVRRRHAGWPQWKAWLHVQSAAASLISRLQFHQQQM